MMWLSFILLNLLQYLHASETVINVVLMGATGNLAQKYLWQSLRNIESQGMNLMIWPAATRAGVQHLVDTMLRDNVTYPNGDSDKQRFLKSVGPYHQLAASDNYVVLNKAIEEKSKGKLEIGRLVYLSVPPKFFGAISKEINEHLRPKNGWLKVIVEKPFGVDLNSALQLSRDLFSSLKEDEVLCVDHYMGKDGLRGLREFRKVNEHYISNSLIKKIKRIEVQMVETEDCKGRTSFYDEVGVIRDTMQNHLMMMLSLLTMDMDEKEDESHRRALLVDELESLTNVNEAVQAIGQYSDYINHMVEDYEQYHHKKIDKQPTSSTPTYARIALRFKSSSPYRGIPIIFTSGKALKKRRAFIRAIMVGEKDALTFNVQGELDSLDGGTPIRDIAIHATEGLSEFTACPMGWRLAPTKRLCDGPRNAPNAYEVLLFDALQGRFESFVSIPEVLHSWRVWDPLLNKLESRKDLTLLKYKHGGQGLDDVLNGGSKSREEL